MFTKRNFIFLSIIVIFLFAGFTAFSFYSKKPDYNTVEAKKSGIKQVVSASGEVRSEDEIEFKFPVSGKLIYLAVKKNDKVAKWDYIASLDKKDLLKALDKSLRDYSKERNDFDEDQKVTYKGVQNPKNALTDTAKRILEKNQWDLERAVLDVELADFAAKNADLYSPIDGVVTKVHTQAGTSVVAGTTSIVTVANPDKIFFIARVDESNIADVSPGQEAIIELDAFTEKKFTGRVIEVDEGATVTDGNKAYFVKIEMNDPARVKMDMSGEVEIVTFSRPNVIVIPKLTIMEKEGKEYVEVLESGQPKKKEIKTGLKGNGGLVEVVSGLNAGDKVVFPGKKK